MCRDVYANALPGRPPQVPGRLHRASLSVAHARALLRYGHIDTITHLAPSLSQSAITPTRRYAAGSL